MTVLTITPDVLVNSSCLSNVQWSHAIVVQIKCTFTLMLLETNIKGLMYVA